MVSVIVREIGTVLQWLMQESGSLRVLSDPALIMATMSFITAISFFFYNKENLE